jgi:hypothetical protein
MQTFNFIPGLLAGLAITALLTSAAEPTTIAIRIGKLWDGSKVMTALL